MKKLVTFSIFCLWATAFFAQTATVDNPTTNVPFKEDQLARALNTQSARNITSFDGRYEGVKGTPFLFEEWTIGALELKDSTFVKNRATFKFDLINNEIWIKTEDEKERILFSNQITSLKLLRPDGQKYLFKKVKLPEGAARDYHHFSIVLFEGTRFTLVKDMKKVFRKANLEDKGIVTVGNPFDWFEEINTYYIQKGKEKFAKITPKRDNFIELINKLQGKEAVKFCKEYGLRGKLTDAEATALVTFMDGLK